MVERKPPLLASAKGDKRASSSVKVRTANGFMSPFYREGQKIIRLARLLGECVAGKRLIVKSPNSATFYRDCEKADSIQHPGTPNMLGMKPPSGGAQQ